MTEKELRFAAILLSMAADEFANHCCNDFDPIWLDGEHWTAEEKVAAAKKFDEWNGDPESERKFESIGDSAWMAYFAARLKVHAWKMATGWTA